MRLMLAMFLLLTLLMGMLMTESPMIGHSAEDTSQSAVSIAVEPFGETEGGKEVSKYTLSNTHGVIVEIITYGGIITSILVPDQEGNIEDIALGFDTFDKYLAGHPYFGAIIGRYGNRIAGGKFTLDGEEYTLAQNNGPNALHGGLKGFDKKVWDAETVQQNGIPTLKLISKSEHGEEGYPGDLTCTVLYSLNEDNELKIEYFAETTQATPVNLTNHTYFNLHGHQNMESILNHELMLNADTFTPVNEDLIPTGEIRLVENTPFDFTEPTAIGKRINNVNQQLKVAGGYDHNFVLNKQETGEMSFGGRVLEPESGRILEFYSTQPGVQFYTGNFLDGSLVGKNDVNYEHRYGFCLETQHFPDTPNQPHFPSTTLRPGEVYHQTTKYVFKTQ